MHGHPEDADALACTCVPTPHPGEGGGKPSWSNSMHKKHINTHDSGEKCETKDLQIVMSCMDRKFTLACIKETLFPTTAVSPITRPVPWSNNIPSPIFAAVFNNNVRTNFTSTKSKNIWSLLRTT